MGKFLRPRRGNVNEAIYENITLYRGEIFLEYPEGAGVGKSPGRIIIGTGDDTYSQKKNVTRNPDDYQPFITDPSLYVPIYSDSHVSENYSYEDTDRGASILENIIAGVTKLPVMLGLIKSVLCRHTDNLRYDNDRICTIESTMATLSGINVLDIKTKTITLTGDNPNYLYMNAVIDSGYEFLKWDQVIASGSNPSSTTILFPLDVYNKTTRAYPLSSTYDYTRTYKCSYTLVKRA